MRALAASIRAGTPPAAAVVGWPAVAPAGVAERVSGVARRVALGQTSAAALEDAADRLGPVSAALARCFSLHRAAGGSLPALLERVAHATELDAAAARTARATTSGARLSARLVAALPLAFAPLTAGGDALAAGPAGAVLLTVGVALGASGLWWIGKLVPHAPGGDDGAAALADDLSVALSGGIPLEAALTAAAEHPPAGLADTLARARRRVCLGAGWVDALRQEGGAVAALAEVLARSRASGVPAAGPLHEWAEARRAAVRTGMQRALRRAPVLMVVPLTVCVLPSFALLAFGPFVLGAFASH